MKRLTWGFFPIFLLVICSCRFTFTLVHGYAHSAPESLPLVSGPGAPVAPGVVWFGACWWLELSLWSGLAPGLDLDPGGQSGETVGRGIGRVGGIVVRDNPEIIMLNIRNGFLFPKWNRKQKRDLLQEKRL